MGYEVPRTTGPPNRTVEIPWPEYDDTPKQKEPPFHCDHCGKPDNSYGVHLTGEILTKSPGFRNWMWFCNWECMAAYVKEH